jgi:hypothetical protein
MLGLYFGKNLGERQRAAFFQRAPGEIVVVVAGTAGAGAKQQPGGKGEQERRERSLHGDESAACNLTIG